MTATDGERSARQLGECTCRADVPGSVLRTVRRDGRLARGVNVIIPGRRRQRRHTRSAAASGYWRRLRYRAALYPVVEAVGRSA